MLQPQVQRSRYRALKYMWFKIEANAPYLIVFPPRVKVVRFYAFNEANTPPLSNTNLTSSVDMQSDWKDTNVIFFSSANVARNLKLGTHGETHQFVCIPRAKPFGMLQAPLFAIS